MVEGNLGGEFNQLRQELHLVRDDLRQEIGEVRQNVVELRNQHAPPIIGTESGEFVASAVA